MISLTDGSFRPRQAAEESGRGEQLSPLGGEEEEQEGRRRRPSSSFVDCWRHPVVGSPLCFRHRRITFFSDEGGRATAAAFLFFFFAAKGTQLLSLDALPGCLS